MLSNPHYQLEHFPMSKDYSEGWAPFMAFTEFHLHIKSPLINYKKIKKSQESPLINYLTF